jgi:hypothetical protein
VAALVEAPVALTAEASAAAVAAVVAVVAVAVAAVVAVAVAAVVAVAVAAVVVAAAVAEGAPGAPSLYSWHISAILSSSSAARACVAAQHSPLTISNEAIFITPALLPRLAPMHNFLSSFSIISTILRSDVVVLASRAE